MLGGRSDVSHPFQLTFTHCLEVHLSQPSAQTADKVSFLSHNSRNNRVNMRQVSRVRTWAFCSEIGWCPMREEESQVKGKEKENEGFCEDGGMSRGRAVKLGGCHTAFGQGQVRPRRGEKHTDFSMCVKVGGVCPVFAESYK